MQCWFWNIAMEHQKYFKEELGKGRLRQGWSYSPELDLHAIKRKLAASKALDEEESAAWARCQPMLEFVELGDLVVVKNVPDRESFTIVRIVGEYQFKIDPKLKDFGHFLGVDEPRVFNKYSEAVPAPFINAVNRAQNPIIVTYKHKETVAELHGTKRTKAVADPEPF